MFPKSLRFYLSLVFLLALSFVYNDALRNRSESIVAVNKTSEGALASENGSNNGRLKMWQVGVEFFQERPWFGTGFENSANYMNEFFNAHPGYRERFVVKQFSMSDQHNSYLAVLVQMGLFFSVFLWGAVFFCGYKLFMQWYQSSSLWAATLVCLLVADIVIFVFYGSILTYEMVALLPFLPLIPKSINSDIGT
jgi:O-antigen ligase